VKNSRIAILLFAALGVLLLLYFFLNRNSGRQFQWYESYRADSDQPYGTKFIQKMLEGYNAEGTFVVNTKSQLKNLLDSSTAKKSSYVFVGQSLFIDEQDADALYNFMYAGGDAFIASLEPAELVINGVYLNECQTPISFGYNETDFVRMNFFHEKLKHGPAYTFAYRYGSEDVPYEWAYIADSVFCDATKMIVPLGHHYDGHVNFVKIPVGEGNLFVHTNPIVFTNYFLTQPDKVAYASAVFSHLSNENILWDEYSKIPYNKNSNAYNSPLYYIMQQPALKYAWWMLLGTVLLYILFASKRQQRVIPVLEQKSNTSLEYVNLISTLHYQNENHLDMARKKMRYFLYFVRSKYGIHAEKFSEQHIRKLAEKSTVSLPEVQAIFDQYHLIEEKFQHNIEANRLLNLYHAIDRFYKHCK
jgi:hypothetical protein